MAKSKRKSKDLTFGIAINKSAAKKHAGSGADALREGGQVIIKSGTKSLLSGAAGYESKLWEKATCKIAPKVNPEDLVGNPDLLGLKFVSEQLKIGKRTRRGEQ